MSQAEKLLATLRETAVDHSHAMSDSDIYFLIDPTTRTMSNGSSNPSFIMQYDHNSTVVTFEIPRFVEGHDMLLCNRVLVHWNNISEFTIDEVAESTELYDLQINPKDATTVICSWTITRNSTQHSGRLAFLIQYECIENEAVTYEWHTDVYSDMLVKPGRNYGEQSIIEYTDILEQWRNKLFGTGDSVIADIEAAADALKASVISKGEETLETIPEDYVETYNMAKFASRTRANAIVITAEGNTVVAEDCSNDYLRGLHVYGRTTQNDEPSLDTPVALMSVEKPKISIFGKNLLSLPYVNGPTRSHGGLEYTVQEDGGIRVVGTVTAAESYFILSDVNFGEKSIASGQSNGVYIWSNCLYNMSKHYTMLYFNKGKEVDTVYYPQVELGTVATWYEKPLGKSISIDYTIRGIPVTSGGTYADINGQQWIADEIDFERGVYIKRIGTQTFTNAYEFIDVSSVDGSGVFFCGLSGYDPSSYTLKMLSDRFKFAGYDTYNAGAIAHLSSGEFSYIRNLTAGARIYFAVAGVTNKEEATAWLFANQPTVYFPLKTPIETPLTDEELFAFSKLHSNYLVTTALNSENAYMGVVYNADTATYLARLPKASDEQVRNAIEAWMDANTITAGSTARIGEIDLISSKWSGSGSLYYQIVSLEGITENSQVDLTPSVEQLVAFYEKDLTFVTENDDGILTVYAIGQKPLNDYSIQVTITEVKT